jgi:hypothetical protein
MPRRKKTETSEASLSPTLQIVEVADPRMEEVEKILALSDSEMEPKVVEKPKRKPRAKKVKETIPTLHCNSYTEATYVLVPAGLTPKLKIGEECVWNVGEYECLD